MTVKLLEDQRDAYFPPPAAYEGLSLLEPQCFLHLQVIYTFHTLLLGEVAGKCCKLSPFNYSCYYGYTRKIKTINCSFGGESISTTLLVERQKPYGKQSLVIVIKNLKEKAYSLLFLHFFLLPSFIHRVIYLIISISFQTFFFILIVASLLPLVAKVHPYEMGCSSVPLYFCLFFALFFC